MGSCGIIQHLRVVRIMHICELVEMVEKAGLKDLENVIRNCNIEETYPKLFSKQLINLFARQDTGKVLKISKFNFA